MRLWWSRDLLNSTPSLRLLLLLLPNNLSNLWSLLWLLLLWRTLNNPDLRPSLLVLLLRSRSSLSLFQNALLEPLIQVVPKSLHVNPSFPQPRLPGLLLVVIVIVGFDVLLVVHNHWTPRPLPDVIIIIVGTG